MKNDTVKCMAVLLSAAILFCAACSGREPENSKEAGTTIAESSRETDTTAAENISETTEGQSLEMTTETEEQETVAEKTLKMKIGEHPVEVVWENNEAANWAGGYDPSVQGHPFGINVPVNNQTPCPRANVVEFLNIYMAD